LKTLTKMCSFILVLAMVLGMLPAMVIATTEGTPAVSTVPTVGTKVVHAQLSSTAVLMDGKLDEAAWQVLPLTGTLKFGAVWDKDNLYLGFTDTVAPGALTALSVNGQSVTLEGIADAKAREIKIPLADVNVRLSDYEQSCALSFTLGETTWEGQVIFTSTERTALKIAADFYNIVTQKGSTTAHLVNDVEHSKQNEANAYRQLLRYDSTALNNVTGKTVVEFDFKATAMPNGTVRTSKNREFCDGLNVIVRDVTCGADKAQAFLYGLVKLNDVVNLVHWADGAFAQVALETAEAYYVRVEYTYAADGKVSAQYFVNGKLVAEGSNVRVTDGNVGATNYNNIQLMARCIGMDCTIDNFSVSKAKTLDKATVLDSLTFDTIRGQNTNSAAVTGKLALPAYVEGALNGLAINWSSDKPEVVAADGTVVRSSVDETVILTAALASDPTVTKTFELIVPGEIKLAVGNLVAHAPHSTGVIVDGTLAAEEKWPLSNKMSDGTKFGAMWNKDNLYLAFKGTTVPEISVKGAAIVDATVMTGSDSVEVMIPLAANAITLGDYDIRCALAVTNGTATWNGTLIFASTERTALKIAADFYNKTTQKGSATAHLVNDADHSKDTSLLRQMLRFDTAALKPSTAVKTVVEFDFKPTTMPNGSPLTGTMTKEFLKGLNVVIRDEECGTTDVKQAFMYGLTKLEGVMTLAHWSDGAFAQVALETAEAYYVRVEYTYAADGEVSAQYFVNGKLVAEGSNVRLTAANAGFKNSNSMLMVAYCAGMDCTIDNVSVSKTKIYDLDAVKAGMSFDVIKGQNENADAVMSDLNLPAYAPNSLNIIPLTWTSSNPAIISTEGVVQKVAEKTKVTLTAKVGDTTVYTQDVNVVPEFSNLEANLIEEAVSLDGKLTDSAWARWHMFSAGAAGAPVGGASAAWSKNMLYLALSTKDATSAKLTINGKEILVDFESETVTLDAQPLTATFNGGIVEISVPQAALDVALTEYNQFVSLAASLTGAGGTVALAENRLCFTGKIASIKHTAQNLKGAVRVEGTTIIMDGTVSADAQYVIGTLAMDRNKSNYFSNTIKIDALPVGDGSTVGGASARDCFYTWISATDASTTGVTTDGWMIFTMIYRPDANSDELWLKVRDGAVNTYKTVQLNRSLGEAFRLSYAWHSNGEADIYLDGQYLFTVQEFRFDSDCNNTITYQYMGSADSSERVQFAVSNITKVDNKYESYKEELTASAILGRVDLNHVQDNLNMKPSFATNLGDCALEWIVGDPSVVTAEGVVTRHDTEYKSTTITLKVNGEELWTKTVTVDPLTVRVQPSSPNVDAAFTASAVKIDGILNEEGWRMGGRVVNANGQLVAEYGFQWNQTHLFVAVDFLKTMESLSLSLNGKQYTVEGGKLLEGGNEVAGAVVTVNDGTVEISIPMSKLAMGEKVTEYGKSMAISVVANGIAGAGTKLALTSIDWWATENRDHSAPTQSSKSTDAEHGVTQIENGWHLYDLYKEGGTNNKNGIRSYILYSKLPIFDYLINRDVSSHFEFDFLANSMPVLDEKAFITSGAYSNSGFTFSYGDRVVEGINAWTNVCGIINTKDGLAFVVQGKPEYYPLGKTLGQQFSVGVTYNKDDSIDLYIDGVLFKTFTEAFKYTGGSANASICINMRRSTGAPTCDADSFDVYMTNLAFGKSYSNEDLLYPIDFEDIAGTNASAGNITADLAELPTSITNGQLDNVYTITWTSSDESVISNTGKVTRPEVGAAIVTLTATLDNGQVRSYELTVPGLNKNNDGVLYVSGDTNPAVGKGQAYTELLFTFDTNNNSIICDRNSKSKFNLVTLVDGDDKARLNAESLTLWISDDNETYTQIKDFKLLHMGREWYLYGFEAEARYVKVHYTHFDGEDANFIGAFGQMIKVAYDTTLVKADTAVQMSVTNNTKVSYDMPLTIAGITGDLNTVRIFSENGELLYHYVDGQNVIVRVPELAVGATAQLYVQHASNGALNLASKENVYEVTYGNRESFVAEDPHTWILTIPAGQKFPDGSTLEKETIYKMGGDSIKVSSDGGLTWTKYMVLNNAPAGKTPVDKHGGAGEWIFDRHTGRIMFQTYWKYKTYNPTNMNDSHMESFILASDDGGKTWYLLYTLPCACMPEYAEADVPRYALSYTAGIEVSTYDGAEGDGIDFVFPLGSQLDSTGAFATRVAYTRDAGNTWQYSASKISYPTAGGSEAGCSEAYIIERTDGVLVLYVRTQDPDVDNFGVSYSLDKGVTWTELPYMSDIYTVNTQPVLKWTQINGQNVPLFNWGGNNVSGGRSSIRNPLNFALSTNDGETFRNIQNIFAETYLEDYSALAYGYITNPSFDKFNGTDMILAFRRNLTKDRIMLMIQDFDKWFTRTKGAYDNFEHGTVQYEGWNSPTNGVELSMVNARGKYSMKLLPNASVTRSIPYLQNGSISLDLFVAEDSNFTLELQSAYSRIYGDVAMPIGLRVENGELYLNNETTPVATLAIGWNTLTFGLELTEDKANLSVNGGEAINIPVISEAGDYICYITFGTVSSVYVDELLVVSELDVVLTSDEEDKAAANAVIEQIKAIETAPNNEKRDMILAARAAFDALTQVQKDLVDRRVVGDANTLVNYYDELMATPIPGVAQIGDVQYATLEEAIAAAQEGDTIVLLTDVTLENGITLNNVILDGNNHTLTVTNAGGMAQDEEKAAIFSTNGLTVKNLTIKGGAYGIYVNAYNGSNTVDVLTSDVVLENVTILESCRAFNVTNNYKNENNVITVTNSTFAGKISHAGNMTATFTGCTFSTNESVKGNKLEPHGALVLNTCTFNSGYELVVTDLEGIGLTAGIRKDRATTVEAPEGYRWNVVGKLVAVEEQEMNPADKDETDTAVNDAGDNDQNKIFGFFENILAWFVNLLRTIFSFFFK